MGKEIVIKNEIGKPAIALPVMLAFCVDILAYLDFFGFIEVVPIVPGEGSYFIKWGWAIVFGLSMLTFVLVCVYRMPDRTDRISFIVAAILAFLLAVPWFLLAVIAMNFRP